MTDEQSPLGLISEITELNDLSEYMQDPELDRALHIIIKTLTERGVVPQAKLPSLIVELQALATVFALKATYFMTVGKGGSEEAKKKNIYFTARDSINRLTDSLKYSMK